MREERYFTDYGRVPLPVLRWPAIFGGVFFAFGIIAILSFFGLAIGAAVANPTAGVTQGAEVWAGIWTLVTLFFGFLAGGWLAGRTSGIFGKSAGRLHGLVTWGLGTAAILYFAVTTTTRLGFLAANVSGASGQVNANTSTVEGMTVTAAVWATIAAICGLVGALVGGHAGAQVPPGAAAAETRRVA